MTQPTPQQLEDCDSPDVTGTRLERLITRGGIAGLSLAALAYVYNDYKALQAQQFASLRESNVAITSILKDNGKMVMETTHALQLLTNQIEEGHKNLTAMDRTIYEMDRELKQIEKNTTKQ